MVLLDNRVMPSACALMLRWLLLLLLLGAGRVEALQYACDQPRLALANREGVVSAAPPPPLAALMSQPPSIEPSPRAEPAPRAEPSPQATITQLRRQALAAATADSAQLDGWLDAVAAISPTPSASDLTRWLRHYRHHPARPLVAALQQQLSGATSASTLLSAPPAPPPRSSGSLAAERFAAPPARHSVPAAVTAPPATPQRIALLLPLSGRWRESGWALQQGLERQLLRQQPALQVQAFDTQPLPQQAFTALAQFAPDLVIGPLLKPTLQAYLAEQVRWPTLLLNDLPEVAWPAGVWSFALLPEHEGASIADWLATDGYRCGLLLGSADAIGKRRAAGFTAAWGERGGCRVAQQLIEHIDQLQPTLQQLLGVEQSRARHRQLERQLGVELLALPRRRADIQFLALDLPAAWLAQVVPLLHFWFADDLQVIATSRAADQLSTAWLRRDLAGIGMVRMPLQQPSHGGDNDRMVAFGEDAAALALQLPALTAGAFASGHTAAWFWLDARQRVERRLQRVQIERGGVWPLCGD